MAVIVLGAGATRGASFVNPRSGACLPPLDTDFFTQLQRITAAKHKPTIDAVLSTAVSLFGTNFTATLEGTFSVIEHTLRMGRAINRTKAELTRTRDVLLQAIAATLEESLAEGHNLRACASHHWLVEHLTPQDTIISFNYDCLIDEALRSKGEGKWNARYGYRLPLPKGVGGSIGEKSWNPKVPSTKDGTIRLLKLHGSTNFTRRARSELLVLKERPYTKQRGQIRFEIIPPESNKRFDDPPWSSLWMEASRSIRRATTLVFIGYSFPLTDQHTSALFRLSVRPASLKHLVIVNPDRAARRRARDVLAPGLGATTRVHVFDYLSDFAAAEVGLWR
jgi:hypothetical protein